MFFPFLFLLKFSFFNSLHIPLSLQNPHNQTSLLAINFSISSPFLLEFRFDNREVELFTTDLCPFGENCHICPSHYLEKQNQSFLCKGVLKFISDNRTISKKTLIKFINRNENPEKIDGFFGLKLLRDLVMKRNYIQEKTLFFNLNRNEMVLGKILKKPIDFKLYLSKDFSFKLLECNIKESFSDKTVRKIIIKPNKSEIYFPQSIFKKIKTFLRYLRIRCRSLSGKRLSCRKLRNQKKEKTALLSLTLQNNKEIIINLLKLIPKCPKTYCETLISYHKSNDLFLTETFLKENLLELNFETKSLSIKPRNNNSNIFLFVKHVVNITNDQTDSSNDKEFLKFSNFAKFFVKIGIIGFIFVISVFLARKAYRCMSSQIEKSLPNYKPTSNKDDRESVNSFRAISKEIQKARMNNRIESDKRVRKPIFEIN